MTKKNNNLRRIAIGAGAIALTVAAAGAAGAVLSNRDLRKKLGKRANQALEIVSNLAEEMQARAQGGLRVIEKKAKKLPKPKAKKASKK